MKDVIIYLDDEPVSSIGGFRALVKLDFHTACFERWESLKSSLE
jgi:hypothetical protein